jgi:hypothetical protein
MVRHTSRFVALLVFAAASAAAFGADLKQLASDAVGTDAEKSQAAIAELRKAGPEGLDAMLAVHSKWIGSNPDPMKAVAAELARKGAAQEWARVKTALDKVAGQKDAHASRLYWYTDHAEALKAAAASHKPILSLRMLGKLTDDLSCANSRFFRTTLYPNQEVAAYLRDNFILEWESVRPVPKITIDMGDGRKIERTITGNSIHYVMDEKGRVVDGVPGLYGAKAFLTQLAAAETQAKSVAKLNDAEFVKAGAIWHTNAGTLIGEAWQQEFMQDASKGAASADVEDKGARLFSGEKKTRRVTATLVKDDQVNAGRNAKVAAPKGGFPDAEMAGEMGTAKISFERNLIRAVVSAPNTPAVKDVDEKVWQKIASRHYAVAALDSGAQSLMKEKNPALAANDLSVSKYKVETPMLAMMRNLQNSIAIDTVRNEYLMHATIHQWLAGTDKPVVIKQFNDRVYADLFLTPGSDPWLGLVPADTYSALDNEGLCTDVASK